MNLYARIRNIYPDLKEEDFNYETGNIRLQDDSDDRGPYIHTWKNKDHPKPTDEQIANASDELLIKVVSLEDRLSSLGIDSNDLAALIESKKSQKK